MTNGTVFRQHYSFTPPAADQQKVDEVFISLCEQWVDCVAQTPANLLQRWAVQADEPLLEAEDLGALVNLIDTSDEAIKERIIRGLVIVAQEGDPLAAQTIQQALLPAFATRLPQRGQNFNDLYSIRLGNLWQAIYDLPLDRTEKTYGRLVMDALHKYNDVFTDASTEELRSVIDDRDIDSPMVDPTPPRSTQVLDLLVWAREREVLTADEATFLADQYIPSTPGNPESYEQAAQLGVPAGTLRWRRKKIAQKLKDAVWAALDAGEDVYSLQRAGDSVSDSLLNVEAYR